MNNLKIRDDDVLQVSNFSKDQKSKFAVKSPFEYFLEADKVFKEYNYPCILAILSEGIDKCPEWVDYINDNIDRYEIELHGSSHLKYIRMSEEKGYEDLKLAKEKIENTFNKKITTWYVPFGRSNLPEWGNRVCDRLGIKFDVPTMKCLPYFWDREPKRSMINFHFWSSHQTNKIKNIIKTICEK